MPELPERAIARRVVEIWKQEGPAKEWWGPGRTERLEQLIEDALKERGTQA